MNGFTNPETYALVTWLSNDETVYCYCVEILASHEGEGAQRVALREGVRALLDYESWREEHGEAGPWPYARVAAEVGSLWRVNWAEVAEVLWEVGA